MSAEPLMAADSGAPSSPDATAATWRVPFNVVDEIVHLLDTETAPWSIQLEARVTGSLEEERLRAALRAALGRHPMARARRAASRRTRHRDVWEIPPTADLDPLRVVDCADDAALGAVRARLQSMAVPLTESPPWRAVLARHPGGDVLMLNLNHAATDGFGGLRLLRSVARAYQDAPDPLPDLDFHAERDLVARLAAADAPTRIRRYLALAEKLRDLLAAPARLAVEQADDTAGYGIHHIRLGIEDTQRLVHADHAGSVNDVLLAALHLATADWNQRHGAPCRRVAVLVPANLRPPAWRQEAVGNFSLPARISTSGRHRTTPAAALAAVTAQTSRKKRSGMGTGLLELLGRSHLLPLWAKEVLVALIPVVGNRFVDTAILSNLGHLDDPPWFGDDAGETVEVWFSAPARMPLGLSIGAVTVSGCLHLALRYRHRQFGPDAARRFAQCYLTHLQALTAGPLHH